MSKLMVQTEGSDPHKWVDARLHFLAGRQGTHEFEGDKVDLALLAPFLSARSGSPATPQAMLPVQRAALTAGIELTWAAGRATRGPAALNPLGVILPKETWRGQVPRMWLRWRLRMASPWPGTMPSSTATSGPPSWLSACSWP